MTATLMYVYNVQERSSVKLRWYALVVHETYTMTSIASEPTGSVCWKRYRSLPSSGGSEELHHSQNTGFHSYDPDK